MNSSGLLNIIKKPVLVKELIIPEPAWVDTLYVYGDIRRASYNLLLQKPKSNGIRRRRVYLSRSRLKRREYGYVFKEEYLEERLSAMGFEIVHPQELSFYEQVDLFNEAEYVVGLIGSAFHTMLFADCHGLSCVYLCYGDPNINFLNIDAITGEVGNYIQCATIHPYALKKLVLLDVGFAVDSIIKILDLRSV